MSPSAPPCWPPSTLPRMLPSGLFPPPPAPPPAPPRMLPRMSPRPPPPADCACAWVVACPAPLGELLADVGQHDRRQDRQQFLDQVAATGARSCQRGGDGVAVIPAEDFGDEIVALVCIDLVDVDPAVEQVAVALLATSDSSSLESMSLRLDILRQPSDQRRDQRLMALFTSPWSAPIFLAISATGICAKSSSSPAIVVSTFIAGYRIRRRH